MIENSVLETMIELGGKFEKRLAELYYCADSENSAKLETAFSDIFNRYKNLAIIEISEEMFDGDL
jgi:hypothetical protein